MITLTIRFTEIEGGLVDADGQFAQQCITRPELEKLRQYDVEHFRADMCKLADAALSLAAKRNRKPHERAS